MLALQPPSIYRYVKVRNDWPRKVKRYQRGTVILWQGSPGNKPFLSAGLLRGCCFRTAHTSSGCWDSPLPLHSFTCWWLLLPMPALLSGHTKCIFQSDECMPAAEIHFPRFAKVETSTFQTINNQGKVLLWEALILLTLAVKWESILDRVNRFWALHTYVGIYYISLINTHYYISDIKEDSRYI